MRDDWRMTYHYKRCWGDGNQQPMQLVDLLCCVIALLPPVAGHLILTFCR